MDEHGALIQDLRDRLQASEFYRWAGIELVDASAGTGGDRVRGRSAASQPAGSGARRDARRRSRTPRWVWRSGPSSSPAGGMSRSSSGSSSCHRDDPGQIIAHGRSVKIGSQLGSPEADVVDPGGGAGQRALDALGDEGTASG